MLDNIEIKNSIELQTFRHLNLIDIQIKKFFLCLLKSY